MPDDKRRSDLPHNIILEGRGRLSVSGVIDVESFDEESVNLSTTCGLLSVKGNGLHIDRLSLETGELSLEGQVEGLNYSDQVSGGGFFSRLFR